ncbi:hypothetical protein G6F50_014785 [Rhizopus delemar]|uniref:Uncharacterized protein n=1 Tax=Rhizopus delemar TaxID=936053 RepID=A0A9P6Y2Q3_9FUNG|nr:hypothetical protein G6F50_014785 [Rhizopus delemar]
MLCRAIKPNRLADPRQQQAKISIRTGCRDTFEWVIPRMDAHGEAPNVSRQQQLGTQQLCGIGGLLRRHVQVSPAPVVLAAVQRHQIEARELGSDGGDVGP